MTPPDDGAPAAMADIANLPPIDLTDDVAVAARLRLLAHDKAAMDQLRADAREARRSARRTTLSPEGQDDHDFAEPPLAHPAQDDAAHAAIELERDKVKWAEAQGTEALRTEAFQPSGTPPPDAHPRVETVAFAPAPPRVAPAADPVRGPRERPAQTFKPAVTPGTMRARHYGLVLSFLVFVVAPIVISGWYLWTRAADQYASYVGFSVQKEETDPAVALLGGITSLSSSSSSDTDILYEYMYSQSLVAEIDAELNLRAIWSKAPGDPVFNYDSPGTIEDLLDHWERKVTVFYDSNTRLIELRVLAFDPDDARAVATAVYDKSTAMINQLAETAREDSVRYAQRELDDAVVQLKAARAEVTAFRNRNRLVDPSADVASQSGLLANLQEQLANALIELDTLRLSSQDTDPRIPPAERKVKVIEARIDAERSKLGSGGVDAVVYANVVAEYESLYADREFAEEAYKAARSSFDTAQAEARRQGRYLAAHIPPTRAESPQFPQREILLMLVALFAFALWSICALLYYSLRDRR